MKHFLSVIIGCSIKYSCLSFAFEVYNNTLQLKFNNKTTVLNRNIKQFISLHTGYKRIEQTLILNHPVGVVVYVFVIHQEYSEDHDINIRAI